VWGGAAPLDRPAWYVWLQTSPGAFQLGLEEAGPLSEGAGAAAWHARFSIRYYPAPLETSFALFSAEERVGVLGGWLDETGTPRIELADRIPEALFVVGSLEWAATADGEAAVVGLSALDRLRM
jgi:hypothetical protein